MSIHPSPPSFPSLLPPPPLHLPLNILPRFGRDLPFAMLVQTWAFVIFNKVCTAQVCVLLILMCCPSLTAVFITVHCSLLTAHRPYLFVFLTSLYAPLHPPSPPSPHLPQVFSMVHQSPPCSPRYEFHALAI